MELFWRLVLGHLIADFTLQTNYIAAWKRRNIWGLVVHCAIHPLLYTLLLWRYLNQVWVQVGVLELTGCTCVALIFITHFTEDEWRIWSVLKKGAPDNTFFYVWDQVIHYAVIFAISPVVDGAKSKFGFIGYPAVSGVLPASIASRLSLWDRFFTAARPEHWVLIAILFAVVTHFTTVTIYFIEKDFFGGEFPDVREKYLAMAERVAVAACFLLPGRWWLAVLGIWLGLAAVCKSRRAYGITWTSLVVGNLTAVACGIMARILFYS